MHKGKTIPEDRPRELETMRDEMFAHWQHFDSDEAECRFVKQLVADKRRHRRAWIVPLLSAAAVVLLLFGITVGLQINRPQAQRRPIASTYVYKAPAHAVLRILLPDSSRVELSSGSVLSYKRGFGRSHRDVKLSGRALFTIVHREDLPMRIHSPHMTVTDLGTVFRVNDNAAAVHASVTLYSGKAEVQGNRPAAKAYTLQPHESITINTEGKLVAWSRPAPKKQQAKPVNNDLFFDDLPLTEIAQRLSEAYDVEIVVRDGARKLRFDGYFNRKEDQLEDIIHALTESENLDYKKVGDKYIIN